jgi:16S rRNA (cytosine967-C5)-methyltransferase
LAIALASKVSAARWAAFEILRRVEDGVFSSGLLATEEPKLEPSDRALCHELVLGVLRWQLYLDKIIEHYSNRKTTSLDKSVLIALRLGLYQLRFLTRIPASAAVDESVKIVHAAKLSSARAFVNAILRRATREPEFNPASDISDPIERLAVENSHPAWLVARWTEAFGFEETKGFTQANNQTPTTSFRVVQTKAVEADALQKLSDSGVPHERSNLVDGAWRVSVVSKLVRELAERGEIYLQDEASQLVAKTVGAADGEQILDLCSAPGGKTTLIAESSNASVVAVDVSERRLATVATAIELQGLKNVQLILLDGSEKLPFGENTFDRVLVDAPCSGTGTLRRNPEIRWRLSIDDIQRLSTQQQRLLISAARVLKPGGRLVYSTCSVEREEDEHVVATFLQTHRQFNQVRLTSPSELVTETGALRTWPQHQGTDGFFVAAFEKV